MTQKEKLDILYSNAKAVNLRLALCQEEQSLTSSALIDALSEETELSPEELFLKFDELSEVKNTKIKIALFHSLLRQKGQTKKFYQLLSASEEKNTAAGAHGKAAYVKNSYNLQAFGIFSQSVPHAKCVPCASFASACEAVFENECEFCIIPIENSREGKLLSFYSLIDRYDLKIISVCDIEDEQGGAVRYALLSKELSLPQRELKTDGRFLLEFSIISDDGDFLQDLLSAAHECSSRLLSFNSCPVSYDGDQKKFFFLFDVPSNELLALAGFVTLEYHSCTILGFYREPLS